MPYKIEQDETAQICVLLVPHHGCREEQIPAFRDKFDLYSNKKDS